MPLPLIAGMGSDQCDYPDCQFHVAYYQWTAWVLLLLALLYFIPR